MVFFLENYFYNNLIWLGVFIYLGFVLKFLIKEKIMIFVFFEIYFFGFFGMF